MNSCQKIEPLIYLYRNGELSVDEKTKVDNHIKTCPHCHEILHQLLSMDNALVQLRESVPDLSGDAGFVVETINRISNKTVRGNVGEKSMALLDEVFGWLRPALSIVLVAASVLFIVQQSRDAAKVAELENRLRAHGDVVVREALRQNDLASVERSAKTLMSSKLAAAAIMSDPSALLGSGFMDLFRHNTKLFEELARRYPNLSSITLDDGIDERERKILATEGKAFIKEFEQMIVEGEK